MDEKSSDKATCIPPHASGFLIFIFMLDKK